MWSRLTGGDTQSDVEAAKGGSSDEREQQEFLIQQLKDLLRVNEERLQQKERELEESNAKFQKLKLQSKAKLQQLTSQIKAQKHSPSPDVDTTSEDAPSGDRHASSDASEQSSRGRILVLKRQLEEVRQQYQKKEQEMENSKKALEAMVEQLQTQLVQRDKILMDLGASGDSVAPNVSQPPPQKTAEQSAMEENRLYAQMVYKDSRILELNNHILELEARIMDLQENLKEKDGVLQARNKAIQLMTEDLSLRSKVAIDDLDDTRVEMRKMQQEFLEREKSWKEQESHLGGQVASAESKLHEAQGHLQELEATRFNLAARNAELQQKVVLVQEAFEKQRVEMEKTFREELDAVKRELEAKTAALEEVQSTLKETTNQSDAKILKARAMERRRAKALERELEELKQGATSNEQVTVLQQRIAELEEEKGAIQLKMLEMEEVLSAQASRLEEMRLKDERIEELLSQVKAAEGEKISLEMRAAEFEEERDVAEKRIQSMQQELELSRANTESSMPALEVEIKQALEEEARRLNAQHEQDLLVIGELKEKIQDQEELLIKIRESMAVIEAERNDAVNTLNSTQKRMADRDRAFEELEQMLAQEQEAKEKLSASLATREEEIRQTLEDLGVPSLQEAGPMVQNLTQTHKEECERLNKQLKAEVKESEDLRCEVSNLQKAAEELDILRMHLKSIEDSFEYFSVGSVHELKTKWSAMQKEMADSIARSLAEKEKLDAELTRRQHEIEALRETIARKEEHVGCLDAEVQKWRTESEQKEQQLIKMKLQLDEATKELESLKDVNSSERAKSDSKISNLLEQSADLEKEVADLRLILEEKTSIIQELEKQAASSAAEVEVVKKGIQELSGDFKTREDSLTQQLEAALAENQKCSRDAQSYRNAATELENRLSATVEEMAKVMSASEKQIRTLQEQIVMAHDKLQEKCRESSNLESRLSESEEDRRKVIDELKLVQEERERLQENAKQLEGKLASVASDCMEAKALLEARSKEVEGINQRLATTIEEKMALKNMYAQVTYVMAAKEHEMSHTLSDLSSIRENLRLLSDEKEMYKDANSQLLKQVEGLSLSLKLSEQQRATSAFAEELGRGREALQNEKLSLEEKCMQLESVAKKKSEELEDASKSHSNIVEKYEKITKQNEQLKGKLRKLSKEMSDIQSKLRATEEAAKAQCKELNQLVDTLKAGKEAVDAQCAELQAAVAEKREEIGQLTSVLSEAQSSIKSISEENLHLKQRASHFSQKCEELELQQRSTVASSDAEVERLKEAVEALSKQKAELESAFTSLQSAANEHKNANEQLLQRVAALETELVKACSENERYAQQNDELNSTLLKLESCKSRIEEEGASALLESRKALEVTEQLKVKNEEECAKLHDLVKEKDDYIDKISKALSTNTGRLEEACAKKEQLEKEKELLSTHVAELQSNLAKAEDDAREAEHEKEALIMSCAELQDLIRTKTDDMNELQVLFNSKMAELSALKDNAETKQSGLLIKVSELSHNLEQKSGELNLVKSDLSDYKSQLLTAQEEISRYVENVRAAQQENEGLLGEIGALRLKLEEVLEQVALKDDALEKMAQQHQILKSSVEKLTSERLELQEKLQKMGELEEQCRAAQIRVSDLERAAQEKDSAHEELLTELDKAQKELSNLASAYESRVKELQEQVDMYKSKQRTWLELEHALQDELAILREQKDDLTRIMEEMNRQSHITAKELEMSTESTAALQAQLEKMQEEFSKTKQKLEEEVSGYAAKVASQCKCFSGLEAQLDGLKQEKKLLECTLQANRSELQSYIEELTAAIASKDEALLAEFRSVQDLEEQYRAAADSKDIELQTLQEELQGSKQNANFLKEKLESLQLFADETIEKLQLALAEKNNALKLIEEQARCQICEVENLKKQLASKGSLQDVPMATTIEASEEPIRSYSEPPIASHAFPQLGASSMQGGRPTPELSSTEVQTEGRFTVPCNEEDGDALREELSRLRALTKDLEGQIDLKNEELMCTKKRLDEANLQVKESPQHGVAESPSEGTKESQCNKMEKTETELKKLKLAFKKARGELRLKVKILEDRTREAEELKEQNASLQMDLQRTVETLAEEKIRLKELAKKCNERDAEVEQLKRDLRETAEQSRAESEALRTEVEQTRDQLEKLSAEYDDVVNLQSTREAAVHGEIDTLNTDIQRLNTENAEIMRLKAEEVEALQEQLQFLKDDLMKYIDIASEKSQEVEALHKKHESSRASLDKLLGEYSALSEVLLEEGAKESSDTEAREKEMGEYHLAESLKKLVAREKAQVNMLQKSLEEQLQEINATKHKLSNMEQEARTRALRLKEFVINLQSSLQEGHTLPEPIIQQDEDRDIYEGLATLVTGVKVRFLSLQEENQYLLQEVTRFRSMAENMQSDIELLSVEKERLQRDYNAVKESSEPAAGGLIVAESKVDGCCQTETYEKGHIDTMSEKEELMRQVLYLEEQLAELKTKQEASEMQQTSPSSAATSKEDHEETKKELLASKVKSGKMLTKLRIFKEKSEKMEEDIKRLQDSKQELEERVTCYKEKLKKGLEEKAELEELCKSLEEQVLSRVPQHDHDLVVEELRKTSAQLQMLEKEKDELSERIGTLNDCNGRLEVEASHLQSELLSLKEQAEMLTTDNESFQGLVESLQHSKVSLEQQLRTQHEYHTKLIKEKENELTKLVYEIEAANAKLASLNEDNGSLREKYNEVVHRNRSLEEQLHFSTEEKRQLEEKCAALEEEFLCVQETVAKLEKQVSAAKQGSFASKQGDLRQQYEHTEAQWTKTEERLVGTAAQEHDTVSMRGRLEEANVMVSKLKEDNEKKASEILRLQQEAEEMKRRLSSVVEDLRVKESNWIQEREQLVHIQEHLKEAAQKLGDELEELKVKYEEALHGKLQLRGEVEQAEKEKKALAQQLQNWRSYIKDIESNQSLEARGRDVEVDQLKLELEHMAKTLNQIGSQNEELTAELNRALEERNTLQQQLAATQESLQPREAQLHSNISTSSESYVINMDPLPAQPHLEQKLEELQQANEVLLANWRQEQQRRRLIEEELDSSALAWQGQMPPAGYCPESQLLLPKEGAVKIPETNYSITRQFKSHAYKLRRWLQGRQSTTSSSVLHI